jgi:hypothetical protein
MPEGEHNTSFQDFVPGILIGVASVAATVGTLVAKNWWKERKLKNGDDPILEN